MPPPHAQPSDEKLGPASDGEHQLKHRVRVLETALRRRGKWVVEGDTRSYPTGYQELYVATDQTRWVWCEDTSNIPEARLLQIQQQFQHRLVDLERACELGLLLLEQLRRT